MNILIAMPRIVNKSGEAYQFPLGLPYVSAALKNANFSVFTINLNQYKETVQDLLIEQINKNKINVVMTGGLSFQFWSIYQIVEIVKHYDKKLLTVVGGGVITSDPEAAMEALEYVDIGVIGEGEITVPELCKCLLEGKIYDDVAGLIFKDNTSSKKFLLTPPRPPIENIDALPYPDFDGFEIDKTFDSTASISGLNSKRTIYMLASRSCPFQCSFCFHTVGRKYRQRSLDSFFLELEYYLQKYKVKYVCIEDELFSYNSDRIREFCERMKKYNIHWWTQFRVDMVEPWLTHLLKESGCDVMSFGLESADNRVLKSMGKHTTVEQIESTLSKVFSDGMHIEGAFIFGDTAETYETANNTLSFWLNHPQYRIALNTITIFPGSPLYWKAIRMGAIKDRVQYLREGCPQINITQMSNKEFLDIISKCMSYPHMKVHTLENYELLSVDYPKARISLKSTCSICGTDNVWENIKFFTSNALGCKKCGQRYNLFLPDILCATFDKNLKRLTANGEVAF